jgi:hypothetical protein
MLLQKSDGMFELVMWDERLKGADEVTVVFGGEHPGLRIYDPTVGIRPIRTVGSTDSLKLTLSDHPLIIEIGRR